MTSNHQIASGQLIDLSTQVVGLARSTRRAVLVDQEPYVGSLAAILAYLVVGGVLLARRHHIEPTTTAAAG